MKLIHGECIEEMKNLIYDDVKVDMVLTDPPYGITKCEWDSVIQLNKMWKCVKGLSHSNTPILLFGMNPFFAKLVTSNIKDFRYNLIWNKKQASNPFFAKLQPQRVHEEIGVFYEVQPYYEPQMFRSTGELIEPPTEEELEELRNKRVKKEGRRRKRKLKNWRKTLVIGVDNHTKKEKRNKSRKKHYSETHGGYHTYNTNYVDEGTRYPVSIINHVPLQTDECVSTRRVHPTQKPVKLLEYLIKSYTKPGDTVLDFTMGSGSTGVACVNTDRDFIGIELNRKYFNLAKKRIRDARKVKYNIN